MVNKQQNIIEPIEEVQFLERKHKENGQDVTIIK